MSPLVRGLSRMPNFDWLLTKPNRDLDRLQGDILANFPTVYLDPNEQVRSKRFTVMVLNNTCDLPNDRLDNVSIAPLLDFRKLVEFEKSKGDRSEKCFDSYVSDVKRNETTELFYLPTVPGFSEGAIAYLHMVCSVSSKLYYDCVEQGHRLASFTQPGFYFFLMKITNHIARVESDAVSRDVA